VSATSTAIVVEPIVTVCIGEFSRERTTKATPTAHSNQYYYKNLFYHDLDKSIQKLLAIYKVHPEWFEVPKPKSIKGKNEVDYSV